MCQQSDSLEQAVDYQNQEQCVQKEKNQLKKVKILNKMSLQESKQEFNIKVLKQNQAMKNFLNLNSFENKTIQ